MYLLKINVDPGKLERNLKELFKVSTSITYFKTFIEFPLLIEMYKAITNCIAHVLT